MSSKRYQGRVSGWNDAKGYGFIDAKEKGSRVFIHISAFPSNARRPVDGDTVSYELGYDRQRRPRAEAILFEGASAATVSGTVMSYYRTIFVCVFFLCLGVAALIGRIPSLLIAVYAVVSLITIAVYAFDKAAAQDKRRRASEHFLQILALLCGWPGALVAQERIHHKSRKISFQIVFWICVALNCAMLGFLMTERVMALFQ